ncbi:MAG TPA: hypothetical protein PKE63_06885 [Lacibacter sp.]|nr:hypothetical protein [Lacibacter sp.]
MHVHPSLQGASTERPFHIHVLAPQLETSDENLDYYYDFTQSIGEYTRVFETLQLRWSWHPVTLVNYRDVINRIFLRNNETPVVLNLCDGDEVNGTPGLSVIHYLRQYGLTYTGADPAFYENTTSKIPMKERFDRAGVAHAPWRPVKGTEETEGICEEVGTPLIVKPAVSGGSMGLGVGTVVHNDPALRQVVSRLYEGYRGWDLAWGGLVAERFIAGPEFTVFIVGSHHLPAHRIIYTPVERVFHPALPATEKFLSFDRLWETYETEQPMQEQADFYQYQLPPQDLQQRLQDLSWAAYCAVEGTGYGRVDLRQDEQSGTLYVLEVNAQCGLSEDENYTSIGAIARLGKHNYADMILHILQDALLRHYPTK